MHHPFLFLVRESLGLTDIGIRETGISGAGTCFELRVPVGYFRWSINQANSDEAL
ncbi:hypothetical protein J2T61_000784 [Methanocalculus sp. AMF5]|nr:hypothetical protein [Methanocalculus sp. AMF5]